jgi:signal transduction histidine kinase
MKKYFLLQIFYVILIIAFLAMIWEFVIEGLFFLDGQENFSGKIEDVFSTIFVSLIALIYPTTKGLALISNWKELEKILVNQGLHFSQGNKKKTVSLESIKYTLMDEYYQRKKAEESVKQERENFFNMLDQLPVCFHLQADDYTIPFANKMFRQRFGSPDAGKCYQVMHNRSKTCEPCSTFMVFDSRKTESGVWTTQDGTTYLSVVTPFENSEGIKLLMEMAIDITSEQQAKDDLTQVLANQEERIKDRTLALERSNNSLKEFTSFAAHDLKEPLRKIMIFSERFHDIMMGDLGEEAQICLDGLQRSALRMDILIEDLLRLSQVSSQGVDYRQVDLHKVVSDVIDDLEGSYAGARNNISVPALPTIEADSTQMYQLFKNLLSNCFKYAKAEELIQVAIVLETDGKGHLLISIQDNGIGFDEKYKEKIFQPFERLHGHSQYSGTGIGLAICKKVVEGHNGEIAVQSQLNAGTTFTIRLPKSAPPTSN